MSNYFNIQKNLIIHSMAMEIWHRLHSSRNCHLWEKTLSMYEHHNELMKYLNKQ